MNRIPQPRLAHWRLSVPATIYKEKKSGGKAGRWDRPELHKALDSLSPGDTFVVWKVDRLSRSLSDLLHLLAQIETSTTEPVPVTSLREAYEILGIPPGRITLSVAQAAHRARVAEYRPDKVMHLGKELQELAARKTTEINLAIDFIGENCTRPAAVPGQSATRSPEPPAGGNSAEHSGSNGSIYPKDSIVSAAEDDPQRLFVRGPFDSLEDDAFCDPLVEDLDYIEGHGRKYISINSWRGRIQWGTEKGCLLGSEILELASKGGWNQDNNWAWEEVFGGGEDVIPHYVTKHIAVGLREFLRTAPDEIEIEDRTILRDTLLRAAEILEAGPTTIPW